ncbi:MAG: D-serine ammonia-lyase [Deltaproteobacteria bacterium]|nr:D-serine ammonia-lyase [Deltaproteobacteria bacterium]MBW2305080.1 D-serine ammonia-lyase [Deltaproteobacteria bacterium]
MMNFDDSASVIDQLKEKKPLLWINSDLARAGEVLPGLKIGIDRIQDAADRLERFAPLLVDLFPELKDSGGIIESDLVHIPAMGESLCQASGIDQGGAFWVKADHALPVAGSVKARGGIYEVLLLAENLALENGLISVEQDYSALRSEQARRLFGRYTVSVGSTGNLGLSIGVMAAALGFKAVVHMSAEAKAWKKKHLRDRGVEVVEHASDYSSAVSAGREMTLSDPYGYFVDDERSEALFLGYSVAALRLKEQLEQLQIVVDQRHPLFVYLPCGVGGAPGGITFGLKHIFGDNVHCFWGEPVQAPCMLLGLATRFDSSTLSVYDIGLDNSTEADGLAVSKASTLVVDLCSRLVSGIFTVTDDELFHFLYKLDQMEKIRIEPSAAAGFAGPGFLLASDAGKGYLTRHGLTGQMAMANHIVWTTGGRFVPEEEFSGFLQRGSAVGMDCPSEKSR